MSETYYTPGVCNLNPAETKKRRNAGYLGSGLYVVVLIVLAVLDLPAALGLVLFVPVALAAIGFLQARNHFCVSFAASGIYSADDTSKTSKVADSAHKQDKTRARRINTQALAIGIVVALASCVLLWFI